MPLSTGIQLMLAMDTTEKNDVKKKKQEKIQISPSIINPQQSLITKCIHAAKKISNLEPEKMEVL